MRVHPRAALLCACWAATAAAHSADVIVVRLGGAEAHALTEHVALSPWALGLLAPGLGAPGRDLGQADLDRQASGLEAAVWEDMPLTAAGRGCVRTARGARIRGPLLELTADFRCPDGELAQTFRFLSRLPPPFRVVLDSDVHGVHAQGFAQGDVQRVLIPAEGPSAVASLGGWVRLGVLHILTGYDHVAFLVALLLAGGTWRRLLVLVTSFTVAHSLTLGATALGFVPFQLAQQRWAEVAIAASVVYVAAENLLQARPRHRPWITFAFGLVHGFGFASVLKAYGLEASAAVGLLGFNLGVEVGQLALVAAVFPAVLALGRVPDLQRRITQLASLGIVCLGGYWLVHRLLE